MRKFLPIILLMILAGCAHVVAPDLRAQADKTLSTKALFSDPDLHRGKTVIVGGEVIETRNLEESTEIEVLEKPLDSRGRPLDTDVSRGRFIVRHPERLDPAIFSPGREVTVVAEVLGLERRLLGEIEYPYVMLGSKAVYIHRTTASGRRIPLHFGIGIFHAF
jgi:outer membrane lipoprotein